MRLVLRRSRHDKQAAEGRSSSGAECRWLRMIAACCGVEVIQGGSAEWACRRHRNGATVTSQRSERKNRRPAGVAVVQHEIAGAGRVQGDGCSRGLLWGSCARAVRELCGACSRRELWDATGLVGNATTDVVAAAAAAAVRGRLGQAVRVSSRQREREKEGLRLATCGDGDVKRAGLAAAEGNDRSSGW